MSKRPICEDDLLAYVDDVLSIERRADVANFLLENKDAAARVSAYRGDAAALRAALEPVLREPLPSRLNLSSIVASKQATKPASQWLLRRQQTAAAIVLLALGSMGGWTTKAYMSPANEGVIALSQEASASYDTFAFDKIKPVEWKADQTGGLEELAKLGLVLPMPLPDLTKSGYRLMGGRIVPTLHGSGIMLMYENDRGSRLVMLTRQMAVDQNKPMTASTKGKTNGWSWAKNGMGYSLVGEISADELHPIANSVRSQI